MPPRGVSGKRKRQYEKIKQSARRRGQGSRAEEIAARTVNKQRRMAGETKGQKSRKSASSAKRRRGSTSSSRSRRGSSSRGRGRRTTSSRRGGSRRTRRSSR